MKLLTVALLQMKYASMLCSERVEGWIEQLCAQGAQVIVLPEFFGLPYFCQEKDPARFALATPLADNPILTYFQGISTRYRVVIPISVFECTLDQRYFNTLAVIDADGSVAGIYRKSHLPDGPGYEEKFFFQEGDTGFQVVQTRYGRIGCGICWDQWFPEVARILTLRGAEVIVYPSAIGSEPGQPALDSCGQWCRVMQGHAAVNMVPIVTANRIGTETTSASQVTFYGTSSILDHTGQIVAQANRTDDQTIHATFDLEAIAQARTEWGIFADRRPALYDALVKETP